MSPHLRDTEFHVVATCVREDIIRVVDQWVLPELTMYSFYKVMHFV